MNDTKKILKLDITILKIQGWKDKKFKKYQLAGFRALNTFKENNQNIVRDKLAFFFSIIKISININFFAHSENTRKVNKTNTTTGIR